MNASTVPCEGELLCLQSYSDLINVSRNTENDFQRKELSLLERTMITISNVACLFFLSSQKKAKQSKEPNSIHGGFSSFEGNCVLRRWESETLKKIIDHQVNKVN